MDFRAEPRAALRMRVFVLGGFSAAVCSRRSGVPQHLMTTHRPHIVVPFWGSYLEFYKVIPKRKYFGAYG